MSEFKSTTLKTKNINESINEFASVNSLEVSQCDFKINSTETYIKDASSSEFKLFNEDIKTYYDDKEKIINEHVEFSQTYNIKIFEITECKIKLKYKILYGEFSTHPYIIISPSSHIPYKFYKPKELLSLIYKELKNIKARHNILINIFDESMISNLKILIKYIYAEKFVKKVKIPLFDGITPEITQESKLVIRFLQNENNNQVIEVEENEVLVTFYKPHFGRNGLNCHGKEVNRGYANNKDDLPQEIDSQTIRIHENESKKEYISKTRGFVQYSKTNLSINHKIKMDKLLRVQNSLAAEEDNNIEVVISQKDITKDSIGEGVELVSESINISGHVGANSIIEAHKLEIEGATHKDSTQFAKYATINRHKGTLRCHEAKIKLLEGGEVHATKVDIETCLGGSIYAQDVNIAHVKSNLKVYASNSITVRLMSGEDNKLKISYNDIPILVSKLELINDDIDDLNFSLQEAQRHNSSMVNGIKNEINALKDEISAIKNSTSTAKISIEKPLHGLNNIIFTIDDENELIFKTEAVQYTPFYIEVNEDKITLHPTQHSITLVS